MNVKGKGRRQDFQKAALRFEILEEDQLNGRMMAYLW
jgi:hypothetical protein